MRTRYPIDLAVAWLEYGWGIGLAALLLQFASGFMPIGETRDWFYYFLIPLWIFFYLFSLYLPVPGRADMVLRLTKRLLGAYAVAALSYYFIRPLLDWSAAGVWVLALLLADGWARTLGNKRCRLCAPLCMAWFLLCVFSMCRTLAYRIPLLTYPAGVDWLSVMPFTVAIAFTLYRLWGGGTPSRVRLSRSAAFFLHGLAIWMLAIPLFDTRYLNNPIAIHHWKAFLAPAASVRSGGWLLWDVPSQYGFLQTLLIAYMPVSVWQSFYLLTGTLFTASAYIIFRKLFALYGSAFGFIFALLVAYASVTLFFPMGNGPHFPEWMEIMPKHVIRLETSGNPLILPSSSPWRYIFIFIMAEYIFRLRERISLPGAAISFSWYGWGHALWVLGTLWSPESAAYVTLLWLPAVALLALAEARQAGGGAPALPLRMLAVRLSQFFVIPAAEIALLAGIYAVSIGHLPDTRLASVYARSYITWFNTFHITGLASLPVWFLAFGMLAMLCRMTLARANNGAASLLNAAALYAGLAGIWAAASCFVPLSDDVHLISTLPVVIYLLAQVVRILPQLNLPPLAAAAYEKAFLCLCGVLLWITANYFDAGLYTGRSAVWPVHPDVTRLLPQAPAKLRALLQEASLPKGTPILVLARPFDIEEDFYIEGMQPWLLPNTVVGYDMPLDQAMYRTLALRRAEREKMNYGWIAETRQYPLEQYTGLTAAIDAHYTQTRVLENDEYVLRRFERRAGAGAQ